MAAKETFLVMLPKSKGGSADSFARVREQLAGRLRSAAPTAFPNYAARPDPKPVYDFLKFKVGTLDSLIEVSDDLAKVDTAMEATLEKLIQTGEQLNQEADADTYGAAARQGSTWPPTVETTIRDDKVDVDRFLQTFKWNRVKFTNAARVPLKNLVADMQKVGQQQEEEVRKRIAEYSDAKAKMLAAEKKASGSLLHRDIGNAIGQWKDRQAQQLGGSPEIREMWHKVVENKRDAGGRWDNSQNTAVPGIGVLFIVVPKVQASEFKENYTSYGVFADGGKKGAGSDKEVFEEWVKTSGGYRPGKYRPGKSVGASICQIELYDARAPEIPVDLSGVEASTPGGASHLNGFTPFLEGDTGAPHNALTGDDHTFFDANFKNDAKGGLVLDLGAPRRISGYRFRTNPGESASDPYDWKLEGWSEGSGAASKQVEFAPKAGAGETAKLKMAKAMSQAEAMEQLSAQLKVGKKQHVVLYDSTGDEMQLSYGDVDDQEKLSYEVVSGPPPPYSTKKALSGQWKVLDSQREQEVTTDRRTWSAKFGCAAGGQEFTKVRFIATQTRGAADFGPLPYVPFAAVPGTASIVCDPEGEDMQLWSCVVFKQKQAEFTAACRDRKLTVRSFEDAAFDQSAQAGEKKKTPQQEFEEAKKKKKTKLDQARERIGVGFSESYSAWIHLKAVRAFVEAVHRYGLGMSDEAATEYVAMLFQADARQEAEIRSALQDLVTKHQEYAERMVHSGYADEDEQGALQEKYPYVSLRIPNVMAK